MGSNWKESLLTDLYEIGSGLSKPAKDFGSGEPFLSFKDVFNNTFVPETLSQRVRSTPREQDACSIKRGDVFLTRTSETMHELGMSSVALKDYDRATFNGFTKRLRPKGGNELVPEFVAYYLRSPWFRKLMLSFSTMSTRASLNNEMIGRLKISYPSVAQQKAIASVLKSLDDKIELNRQMNATLEAMAQALFKSWFVDFDPVIDNALAAGNPIPDELQARANARQALGNKGKPLPEVVRKQFPDRFVHTEELGWVPEGWGVMPLDKIAHYQNGLALQKYRPKGDEDYLPVVKISQLRNGAVDGEEKATSSIPQSSIINDGDVVFSWSGSLLVDVWCGGKAALNQHLFKVTSDSYPKWFFLGFTRHHLAAFQRIAADKAVTMGHIKREHLSQALCLVPPRSFFGNGSDISNMLLQKQVSVRVQNRTLETLRNYLLPELLSGEVRLSNVEQPFEVA